MDLFKCPPPTVLAEITATDCPIKWDQVQKFAFGRKTSTARFDATTNLITAQATWTALLAATDDSKIVVSPYVSNVTFPSAEAIKQGGNDNTTINGLSEIMGGNMVMVKFTLKNISAATARALRALATETMIQPGETNIEAYFFATGNSIIYDQAGETDAFKGFEIFNMFIPDVSSEGLNTNNSYECSFELKFGWSEYWEKVKADFNPRDL